MPHFDEALNILRDRATDLFGMGRSFERLMQVALSREPGILGDRFAKVWLWEEWPDHDGPDTGIDLVAEEREGGLCAIQCKFFDPHRPVSRRAIDSFLAKSEPTRYTSRLIINTGGPIQRNALRTLQASPKPCRVLDRTELDSWDVDWLRYVDDPESLAFKKRESYTPHPYQQAAIDKVCTGFAHHDRGQLILPCGTGKTAVTLWIAERLTENRGGGQCTCALPGTLHCAHGTDDAGVECPEEPAPTLCRHLLGYTGWPHRRRCLPVGIGLSGNHGPDPDSRGPAGRAA